MNQHLATVVIATTLEAGRKTSIERAIHSVITSSDGLAKPHLIVNGSRVDETLFDHWTKKPEVRVSRLPVGDYLAARRHGRQLVDTPYFGFLDDDDYLLPSALTMRLDVLQNNHNVAAVVSNGQINRSGSSIFSLEQVPRSTSDAFQMLPEMNWFPSAAAGLFRSAIVGIDYFAHEDRHLEWTTLAFRICAAGLVIKFLKEPGFVIEDSPESLSKSSAYQIGLASTLRRILDSDMPTPIRKMWQRKYAGALHDLSDYYLRSGRRWPAIQTHLRALCQPGGLRFLSYTRHLVTPKRHSLI